MALTDEEYDAHDKALHEAQMALLKQLARAGDASASNLRNLAEAYSLIAPKPTTIVR